MILGGIDVALILTSDHVDLRGAFAAVALVVGWGFIGIGLFAWDRRPNNSVGSLMVATGFAWLLSLISASNVPVLFTAGVFVSSVYFVTAIHMLLAAPYGRGLPRGDRRIVTAAYVLVTVGLLPLYLFVDPAKDGCDGCPENAILIEHNQTIVDMWSSLVNLVGIGLIVAVLISLIRRWRQATRPERRLYAPVYAAGVALLIAAIAQLALQTAGSAGGAAEIAFIISIIPLALVPYLFLASLVRARVAQGGAVGELMTRLGEAPQPGGLRDALADALEDPSLELVYWLPDAGRFVDFRGRDYPLPEDDPARAVARIERDGSCVAAIVYDATLREAEQHVRAVGAAAALAMQNERLDAELRAKIDELRASRERMLSIGLEERRRLERNLHDGAQQRLVSMALNIRLARAKLNEDPLAADQLLESAGDELDLGARGAARAGARDPSGGAHRPRARHRARDARQPRPGPGRAVRAPERAAARGNRAGGLLRSGRGAHERREVRAGDARDRRRGARERAAGGGGGRRRDRRRRPGRRNGPPRPGRPDRGAGGPARDRVRARPRNHDQGADPMRVVVADDSVLLREGVVRLLEENGFEVVGQAGDAEDLIRKVRAHKPDVAVVDIRMPPTNTDDGLRAALEIRAELPDTGVLVLSQYVEEGYALDLVGESAGGVGYLLKDRVADVDRFVDSVRRVAEGGSALDPEVVSQLVGRARRDDPLAELTPREREVLELMAEGRSNNAIAEHMVVTERAVEKHVTSIFGKLGLAPAPEDHRRVLAVLAFLRA